MGWPPTPELVPSAEGFYAAASGYHPRFVDDLAEHLAEHLLESTSWQTRAERALRKSNPEAEVECVGDGCFRISYPGDERPSAPPGWRWADGEEPTLHLTEDGIAALARAEAEGMVVVYVGTGQLPDGWSPPSNCPGFIVRPLTVREVQVVEAQVGTEPRRPATHEWQCDPESKDGRAWQRWRKWRLRRDTMFNSLAWKAAILDGEQLDPEAFLERLGRKGMIELAVHLAAEAAQHIYRMTVLPASLGKESAGRCGSATNTPGGAAHTTTTSASGPGSDA